MNVIYIFQCGQCGESFDEEEEAEECCDDRPEVIARQARRALEAAGQMTLGIPE